MSEPTDQSMMPGPGKPDRAVVLEQARQACLQGSFATAYQLYDDLLKEYPGDAGVWMDYGRAKVYEFTDLEQSAHCFLQVLEIGPDSIDAMLWLALVSWMGYGVDYEKAVRLYRGVLERDPGCIDAYIGLGMLSGAPGSPITLQEAIDAYL